MLLTMALLLIACQPPPAAEAGLLPLADRPDRCGSPGPLDDFLRLDHVQALGTHNSYHQEPAVPLDDSHRYSQPTLTDQLDLWGVRQFELDVHLREGSGFEVFHLPAIDAVSSCTALHDCLAELRAWSDDHPCHLPLVVWLEPKEDADVLDPTLTTFVERYEELERAILGAWPREDIVTPDDVRQGHGTLPEALQAEGWPLLRHLRGRLLVSMLDSEVHRAAYLAGSEVLAQRLMFVDSDDRADPFAAMFKIDDAVGEAAAVAAVVGAGMLVTSNIDGTGSDESAKPAELAGSLEAGAHFVSSDRVAPVDGLTYVAAIPGGTPAACHPTRAPASCTPAAIESLP